MPGLTHWHYILRGSLRLRSSREGDLQTPKMSKIVFNCFCEKGGDMRQDFTTTTCGGRKQND